MLTESQTLGLRIKVLRLRAEIPLRELSRRVKVSAAHICDIEHGRRMPSDALLRRIANELSEAGATYEALRSLKPPTENEALREQVRHLTDALWSIANSEYVTVDELMRFADRALIGVDCGACGEEEARKGALSRAVLGGGLIRSGDDDLTCET